METIELLKKSFLCSGLDKSELEAVHKIIAVRQLAKGEILFFEGDPAPGFFILLSGRARVYKSSPDGKEFTIHQIAPGQLFAEAAIFRGDQYPANCSALADAIVAFIPKDAFIRLIQDSPQISLKIIASQAGYLREFTQKVEELTLKDVSARVAGYLLREYRKGRSNEIILDIPKTELARSLGTISETLSRNLKKLKEIGVIRVEGNKISILDTERLNSIAEGEKI